MGSKSRTVTLPLGWKQTVRLKYFVDLQAKENPGGNTQLIKFYFIGNPSNTS